MATRSDQADHNARNVYLRGGRREGVFVVPYAANASIADNYPLTATMPPNIVLGASAARDVLMPAGSVDIDGLILCLISRSSTTTGVLTLKTSADAALSPAVTIAQNGSVEMIYSHDLTAWRKKGS